MLPKENGWIYINREDEEKENLNKELNSVNRKQQKLEENKEIRKSLNKLLDDITNKMIEAIKKAKRKNIKTWVKE